MGPPPPDETFLKFYFFFEKSVFNREMTKKIPEKKQKNRFHHPFEGGGKSVHFLKHDFGITNRVVENRLFRCASWGIKG